MRGSQKVDAYCHIFSVLAGMETALAERKTKLIEKVGYDQKKVPDTAQTQNKGNCRIRHK